MPRCSFLIDETRPCMCFARKGSEFCNNHCEQVKQLPTCDFIKSDGKKCLRKVKETGMFCCSHQPVPTSMDYSQGKIYKIFNKANPELFYIGSTTLSLVDRFCYHRSNSRRSNCFFYSEVKREGGWEMFDIELIKLFPCQNKTELSTEEEKYRSQGAYYNTYKAIRTEEERKEQIAQYKAKYREENKEHISQYNAKYREENKEQIAKYREENKEKIAQRKANNYREKVCKDVLDDVITKIEQTEISS